MNVEIGTEAAQFPFREFFFLPIFGTVPLQCSHIVTTEEKTKKGASQVNCSTCIGWLVVVRVLIET
jgi:hypothetical protein